MTYLGIRAGQNVYLVPTNADKARYIRVRRVGAILATLRNDERVKLSNGEVLHGRGWCYHSKEDYERDCQRRVLWLLFATEVSRRKCPEHLSYDEIQRLRDQIKGGL